MRAEHAAVDVRLVDDDDREVREEVAPARVVGQDPDVEHVGVREDRGSPAAGSPRAPRAACRRRRSPGRTLLARARTRAARAPGPGPAPWSGRGRARAPWRRCSRTSSVGRLKHSDLPDAVPVVTIVGPAQARLERLGLVGVERVDPGARRAPSRTAGCRSSGIGDEPRLAGALERLAHEALVRAPGVEQLGPGLRAARDGHRSHGRCRRPCAACTWTSTARSSAAAARCCTTATATSRCSASARSRPACARTSRSC